MSFIKIELNNFLAYLQNIKNYSEKTILTYKIALEKIVSSSEIYEENEILYLDISKYRLKNSKIINPKTLAKEISALKSFNNYLQNIGQKKTKLIGANSIKIPKTLPKPIDFDNISQVLQNCENDEKLAIEIFYTTGMRLSELANLKISDIRNGWINVIGKGDKERQIPLLAHTEEKIKNYIQENDAKNYIFEKNDKPFTPRQFQYRIKKSFARLGIDASPHKLRHSFATHLLNEGARITDVSELLGHSNISTTSIYTKLSSAKKYTDYLKSHPLNQKTTNI